MSAIVATPKIVLNTAHARDMLHKRYPAGEWALMEEVAPRTGGGTRYADAVAVNLWQSRGHAVHGFEIKVSRSDWLRELKQPAKAEDVYKFCDHWWIVAPAGIVVDGELPPTWGLLEVRESGLVQKIAAPRLEASAITRAFFASLIRRAMEGIGERARRMQHDTVTAARAEIDQKIESRVADRTRQHEKMANRVKEFELSTGLSIAGSWDNAPAIETINLAKQLQVMLSTYGREQIMAKFVRIAEQCEQSAAGIRKAIAESGMEPIPEPADA